ncbi:MAG: endonuclease/exonuclease/phosphatase family protein [Myxococcaceae bacterium]
MARLFLVLVLFATACVTPTRARREVKAGERLLTLVTWNVNFGLANAPRSYEQLEEATRDADLVLLQETNHAWQVNVARGLAERFPHQRWFDDAAAGGQAVLSRRPFRVRQVIESPSGWFPAVVLEAETSLGPVQVLNVHLHPPVSESGSFVSGVLSTGPVRRDELQTYVTALAPNVPTLVIGDFNETRSGDALTWLEGQGFKSALPEFAPAAPTWHWPVGPFELKAQLDHVVYGPGLEPIDVQVLPLGQSDHFPVRARLVTSTGNR